MTGPEFMPALYALVMAVEEGKIGEAEIEFETFGGDGPDTTLRISVRREVAPLVIAEAGDQ